MSAEVQLEHERHERVRFEWSRIRGQSRRSLLWRFGFGFGIAVAAGLAGLHFGPRVGGTLLAFPAVLPASLTLVQRREGKTEAEIDALGAILGGAALIPFALAVAVLSPLAGPLPAIGAAVLAWVVSALALYSAVTYLLGRLQPGLRRATRARGR